MTSWFQKLSIFLLVAVQFSSPQIAEAKGGKGGKGTAGGGGGNVSKSTRADLEEIVSTMYRHLDDISDRYLVGRDMKITSAPLPAELSRMTNSLLGKPYFTLTESFIAYVKGLKIEIADGPCFHEDEERDASTEYKKNAPICLSASRLARFPKSALKQTVIPLIFHEVAHQYGWNEAEATAFQELSELYLEYRTIYLSSTRARISCAAASQALSARQKGEVTVFAQRAFGQQMNPWPKVPKSAREFMLQFCAVRAHSAGENFERIYNGSVWKKLELASLADDEKSLMTDYNDHKEFTFLTIVRALTSPAESSNCEICTKRNVDKALLLMLGAKAALEHIDQEVAYRQSLIKIDAE